MPHRSRFVQFSLALPVEDYSAYTTAVRLLARQLGAHAPDVAALLVHNLRRRDADGLVEDFLESINWPVKVRNVARSARERIRAERTSGDHARN